MHPDLEVLALELVKIRDNGHGGLKPSSDIDLTHSEVISFARAMIQAIDTHTIELNGLDLNQKTKIVFYLKLIETPGIPHRDRSRAAAKCLDVLQEVKEAENNPDELDSIPF